MQVVVGRIGRAHGVRGDVAVEIRSDEPDKRFASGAVLELEQSATIGRSHLTVKRAREHHGRLVVSFEEVGDRAAAESLRGMLLLATVADDETTGDPDEFYDRQLIGLAVFDADARVGEVVSVQHSPAQDLLVVKASNTDGEILIPFVASIVTDVDVRAGTIRTNLPPGLVELATESQRNGDDR